VRARTGRLDPGPGQVQSGSVTLGTLWEVLVVKLRHRLAPASLMATEAAFLTAGSPVTASRQQR
jgi:hypothetical protein